MKLQNYISSNCIPEMKGIGKLLNKNENTSDCPIIIIMI